jgi:hypothetical protein
MLCVTRVAENLIIQDVMVSLFLAGITWIALPFVMDGRLSRTGCFAECASLLITL